MQQTLNDRLPLKIGSVAGAMAAIWYAAANMIWSPQNPPFWAFLMFVGLVLMTIGSAVAELKRRLADRRRAQ